jgi:altronate hydrolase
VDGTKLIEAAEDIEAGHKIALVSIGVGEAVYRYGEAIVEATQAIAQGQWIHVHNTQPIPDHLEE